MFLGSSTVLGNLLFAGLMLRVVGHSAGATGADGVNFLVSISFVVNNIPMRIRMARTVAGNEIILAMNRMIPPAISRNRMAWNGITPLRHSRITPAFITSVTVDLHMPAMSCSFIFFNFMSG